MAFQSASSRSSSSAVWSQGARSCWRLRTRERPLSRCGPRVVGRPGLGHPLERVQPRLQALAGGPAQDRLQLGAGGLLGDGGPDPLEVGPVGVVQAGGGVEPGRADVDVEAGPDPGAVALFRGPGRHRGAQGGLVRGLVLAEAQVPVDAEQLGRAQVGHVAAEPGRGRLDQGGERRLDLLLEQRPVGVEELLGVALLQVLQERQALVRHPRERGRRHRSLPPAGGGRRPA